MAVKLNHTIVWCRDKERSSQYLAGMLGLPAPTSFGHFAVVTLDNELSLDFGETDSDIAPQHYAFLVDEDVFDATFERITSRGIEHWADPGRRTAGAINRRDGGRGVYFSDPDGHMLEIITRPYGSGSI